MLTLILPTCSGMLLLFGRGTSSSTTALSAVTTSWISVRTTLPASRRLFSVLTERSHHRHRVPGQPGISYERGMHSRLGHLQRKFSSPHLANGRLIIVFPPACLPFPLHLSMAQDSPGVSSRQQGLGVPEVRPMSGGHRQGGYENMVGRYARKAIDCTHRRNFEEMEAARRGGTFDDGSKVGIPQHSIFSIRFPQDFEIRVS